MIDLAAAEAFLETMRARRAAEDIAGLVELFTDDAIFRIVGFGPPSVGREAIRATLQGLVESYEFVAWRPIATLVHGDNIAVRHHLTVRHRITKKTAETETSEFLAMRHGKCATFTQYADTVLVAQISTT